MPNDREENTVNRKRKLNENWTNEQLHSAIANKDGGVPIRIATWYHDIPSTSLRNHVYGTTIKKKRSKVEVLSHEEEEELFAYLIKMQNLGFPLQ